MPKPKPLTRKPPTIGATSALRSAADNVIHKLAVNSTVRFGVWLDGDRVLACTDASERASRAFRDCITVGVYADGATHALVLGDLRAAVDERDMIR